MGSTVGTRVTNGCLDDYGRAEMRVGYRGADREGWCYSERCSSRRSSRLALTVAKEKRVDDKQSEIWRPHGIRDSADLSAAYDTLVEGVPDWMSDSLKSWVVGGVGKSSDELRLLERTVRDTIGAGVHGGADTAVARYWDLGDDARRLRLIDAMIHLRYLRMQTALENKQSSTAHNNAKSIQRISDMFDQSGSVWMVGGSGHHGLIRRVNKTTQDQVDLVVSAGTDSARKIGAAWHNCYKMDPNYDTAYADAVLAVEAVSIPVFAPKDNRATLGKVISNLGNVVGDWTVAGLDGKGKSGKPSGETLLAMLETLWQNQQRHAKGKTISGVAQEEAEAAVNLAVTLVQWFSAGYVREK